MKHNTVLIVLSLLNALFFGLHLTGDIVFGLEEGGREILVGVLILAVYLYGAVGLPGRAHDGKAPRRAIRSAAGRVPLYLDAAHDGGDGARRIRPVRAGNLEPPTAPACFRVMSLLASSAKKFKRADLFFFRFSRRRAPRAPFKTVGGS